MRIPRNIEWWAGVILASVAMVFLGLLIVLTLARTDVGLAAEGVMRRMSDGWTLTVEVPGERMRLLRRCKYVRIGMPNGRAWYGKIAGIEGRFFEDRPSVLAEVDVRALESTRAWTDSSRIVRANLLVERGAPVLRVLYDSVLNRQGN